MNNVNLDYIATIAFVFIIYVGVIASIDHATSIKIDCIKSISKDHYTVDEINKLCGVVK